jgi:hypothetical protein
MWCPLLLCLQALLLLSIAADEICLSCDKPVTADVRGNIAPPSVLTNSHTEDWLKDRWQAASDMSGTPIPGPHWVEVELEPTPLTNLLLDWEAGFANAYVVEGAVDDKRKWVLLHDNVKYSREKKSLRKGRHTHI